MAVERAQGSLEILLKEQKKNQYETELLHLLHYSAMNLYSNSLREVDLISGPRRSVRLLTPFREHARRDVTFLDRRRFGQPSKRPCDSAQRAGFSAGGRCFKTTEKKKRCYLNPFGVLCPLSEGPPLTALTTHYLFITLHCSRQF